MLYTSTKLDNNPGFQIYVKKNMRQRLTEIITSFDNRYGNSKLNVFQIIEDYEIVATNERTQLYVKTLLACIRDCDHTQYQKNMESITFRIPNDTETVTTLRRLLIRLKKSSHSATVQERCNSLLQHYK